MVFFLAFAGGETLHILGKPVPYALLPTAFVKHLPVLTNLRTVSRAISYTYLFLGIAVARILSLRQASIDGRARMERPPTRWPALSTLLLALGLVLDFWTLNRESTPVTCPPAYAVMDGDASEFGILDLPLTYRGGEFYMTYQICHHRPIMHAIIGRKLTLTLSDYLADLSPAEVRGALRAARVKYVVIHTQLPSDPPVDVASYERTYPVVYRDPTAIVLKVY
jgi:hypothetical protein